MTSRKVFRFFKDGAFTEDDNRTFWTKSHKFGCILFNKTIVMVYDRGELGLELARMISFKDVSTLISFKNGDFIQERRFLHRTEVCGKTEVNPGNRLRLIYGYPTV